MLPTRYNIFTIAVIAPLFVLGEIEKSTGGKKRKRGLLQMYLACYVHNLMEPDTISLYHAFNTHKVHSGETDQNNHGFTGRRFSKA